MGRSGVSLFKKKRSRYVKNTPRLQRLAETLQRNPGATAEGLKDHFRGGGILEMLEQLEEEGRVFRHQWPWSSSTFWYPTGHDLSKLFQPVPGYKGGNTEEEEQVEDPKKKEVGASSDDTDRVAKLEERVIHLETRNQELRRQLCDLTEPLVYEVAQPPIDFLSAQLTHWQAEQKRILAKLRHAEMTIAALQHILTLTSIEITPRTGDRSAEQGNLPEAS